MAENKFTLLDQVFINAENKQGRTRLSKLYKSRKGGEGHD
jgi:hypothetical protein